MRILFCGLGGIGQRHLRNLRLLLGDRLEAHAYRVRGHRQKLRDNLSIEPGADLVQDYGVTVHSDLDRALAARPIAVFVCNPSSFHIPTALAAAKAGAHIFIEKPLSDSMQGIEELMSIVRSNKLVCYVGYNFRFHPGLMRLKTLIDSGFFGRILTIKSEIGEYLPNWHKYEDYREMYAAKRALGGGVILSQIHEMDLLYWFVGMPDSIYCRGGKLSHLDIDVEDTAASLMQYNGRLGAFPISLHQDFLQRPSVRTFKIVGDRGIAEIDLIKNQMHVYSEDGEVVEALDFPGFQRNDMFLEQARHFLACISEGMRPQVDLSDGVASLKLALAAKESLASGTEVKLTVS